MAWIAPAIGGAVSLIGGAMNSSSARAANASNVNLNQENRDWMTQMSNTAEQRHVADLKAAGLNPGLAYQTSAPVPGSAPVANVQSTQSGQGFLNSAGSVAQLGMIAASTEKMRADAASARADSVVSAGTVDSRIAQSEALTKQVWNSASNLEQDYAIKGASLEMLNRDANFKQRFLDLQLRLQELDVKRAQLGLPRMENDAAWQKAHPDLAPFISSGAADLLLNTAGKMGIPK
jgi:hypothetical protein